MTKRECNLYFRKLKHSIKPYLTNNYKKMHGGVMIRANTLYNYSKKRRIYKRVYRENRKG